MNVDVANDLTGVWHEVSQWPPRRRLALATRILQSLQQESETVPVSKERKEALNHLIGIWRTDNPPTDEHVDQIVKEERMGKYG